MTFDPFERRDCRDARNSIGHAFVLSLRNHSPSPFYQTAEKIQNKSTPEIDAYIRYRKNHLEAMLKKSEAPFGDHDDVYATARNLWNRALFFEVHEWLENAWTSALGDEKKCLQSLIIAATVYEQMTYGRKKPALQLAAKAASLIKGLRHIFPNSFDWQRLIHSLSDLTLPPPKL